MTESQTENFFFQICDEEVYAKKYYENEALNAYGFASYSLSDNFYIYASGNKIYDFMDKYLNDGSSSDDYNDNDGRTYPDWDDRFGNYYFYDQEPDSPGWNDTPYYDTDPGTSEVPGGEFI